MCRLLKGTQFFRTGPFIIYARDGLARMRGGSRRTQESQGGGGVIRKSAHKEEGLPDFLFLFYFQSNAFQEFSGLTALTVCKPLRKGNSSLLQMICPNTTSRTRLAW